MRKKISLVLLTALLLSGCKAAEAPTEPSLNLYIPSKDTQTYQSAPESTSEDAQQQPEEKSGEQNAPGDVSAQQYTGAVSQYLMPLEEYSWEREQKPEFVMLHFTSAVVEHREDPCNPQYVRDIFEDYKISVHYVIDREGTVYCYIPEDRVAWHAGEGSFGQDPKYRDKMNSYAIGIQLLGIGSQEEMKAYLGTEEYEALDPAVIGFTDAQYASLNALVADICSRYDIPADRDHVIGHDQYSPDAQDPGSLLDWDRVLG